MTDTVTIRLLSLAAPFTAKRGSPLRSTLAAMEWNSRAAAAAAAGDVAFVCWPEPGRDSAGSRHPVSAELVEGWRLACGMRAETDLLLDVGDANAPVLVDDARVAGGKRQGLGIAIDVGSTTIAAQLINRATGTISESAPASIPRWRKAPMS